MLVLKVIGIKKRLIIKTLFLRLNSRMFSMYLYMNDMGKAYLNVSKPILIAS